MKNTTIYEALKASATTKYDVLGNEYFEISPYSLPSTEFDMAAKQYAERILKPMVSSGKTAMLNAAMAYDSNNEDLIQDAIVKFISRFDYFISTFNKINSVVGSQEQKAAEFNRIVSTTIPTMLSDQWRKVSEEVEYTEYDFEGNKIVKVGKGLRGTHSALSLFSNQNKSADGTDDEVSLIDCVASSKISALDLIESSDFITECIVQLTNAPRQMLGFFAKYSGLSSNDIIGMLDSGNSNRDIFNYVLELYSIQYECPYLLDMFRNRYSESELTYSGTMQLKKVLDNERSLGNKKISSYIAKHYPTLVKGRSKKRK